MVVEVWVKDNIYGYKCKTAVTPLLANALELLQSFTKQLLKLFDIEYIIL